ncbi:MAG: polyphenol oxidase family protein [Candidatus Niyogibacteria bacterium]|nr:MAG: polyphenol oxidase family protein [Candidatus Niyogibacteria bacterium]
MLTRLDFYGGLEQLRGFNSFPAPHFFTTLQAGNMSSEWGDEEEVYDNFKNFLRQVMPRRPKPVLMLPEHSHKITILSPHQSSAWNIKCDGLLTASPHIALVMKPADCLPVLMTTADRKFVGLIHAGWRGTNEEIASKAVELAVSAYKVKPEEIFIGIGPGIHECCYDDEELARKLLSDERWRPFISGGPLGARIDLLDFNVRQLLGAGVKREHIKVAENCTCHSREKNEYLFFSHHRVKRQSEEKARLEKEGRFEEAEKIIPEPEGRHAAVVSMI